MEDDDDTLELNAATLQALTQFYTERDHREKQFEDLTTKDVDESNDVEVSIDAFTEDWNMSQFWFNDHTATILAKQLLDGATAETRIAIVSTPSVYLAVRNLLKDTLAYPERPVVRLLEFDQRFAVFKHEYILYDFNQPQKLPDDLASSFDRIICDPPFHNESCQQDMIPTVRWLAKSGASLRLIHCTGETMEGTVLEMFRGLNVKPTTFLPEHTNGLQNKYRCYANFECKTWKF